MLLGSLLARPETVREQKSAGAKRSGVDDRHLEESRKAAVDAGIDAVEHRLNAVEIAFFDEHDRDRVRPVGEGHSLNVKPHSAGASREPERTIDVATDILNAVSVKHHNSLYHAVEAWIDDFVVDQKSRWLAVPQGDRLRPIVMDETAIARNDSTGTVNACRVD